MQYLIGIDISTTATKALLIDEHGALIGVASTSYPCDTPRPLWSEQDPELWWQATIQSLHKLLQETRVSPREITGLGLTGQMHGLVLLDVNGEVLRPAILWNDQRSGAQCDEIRSRLGRERLIQVTGNDALTGFTAPKILWVAQNEPHIYEKACHILLPKDFIRFKLTGDYAMDCADGSGTLLFDLRKRTWSDQVLEVLDIPSSWLPQTYEGPQVTGGISARASVLTGLKQGTPVVAGGGDQAAQAVGVGAVEAGIMALTLGTSGVVFITTQDPLVEPEGRLHAFCHALPDRWHFMGVMLSAAGSLQWYRDSLAPGLDFDALTNEAAVVPAGSEGLIFLPYLSGERTPYPDPFARGSWVGLTVRHTRAHLTRSVLEGVAFGIKDCFTLIQNAGVGEINQVRISGGGARSALWRQVMTDILGINIVTVNTTEGAAYGASLLAGVGTGIFEDTTRACRSFIHVTSQTTPSKDKERYEQCYPIYRSLYPALKEKFLDLAGVE